MSGSVGFDAFAGVYDETRGFSPEGHARTIELLATELAGRDPVLEVGVGTGQLAVSLRAAGAQVVGVDLAASMLRVLRGKPGGAEVPVTIADATAEPFRTAAFGAAYLRWVLHLVPAWRMVLGEIVRVVRPGGLFLALLGRYEGPRAEIQRRFDEIVGGDGRSVGLDWGAVEELDAAMAELGGTLRLLPHFPDPERQRIPAFLDAIDANAFSWTRRVPDADRLRAAAEVRRWVTERFGPPEDIPAHEYEITWRAYDLP